MLFSVESDTMSSITMYLIPDSGGTIPSVIVRNGGVELLRMSSNVNHPHIAAAGRHATGQCGFLFDTTLLPDLPSYAKLEIVEQDSGIIVYRRPHPSFVNMKVLRLETHLLPLWRLDDALNARFQYFFKGVDRWGRETAQQTFNLINTTSSYASGRLYMRHLERFLARGLKAIAIVREPYEELAERLIILKNVGEQKADLLGQRDAMIFEGAIAELAEVATFDSASCKRFFKRAPVEVMTALSNPFVRQLTVGTPVDMPPQSCIGMSLQILAEFTILGLRSEAQEFSMAISELLDLEPGSLPVMKEFTKVTELGNILRQIREVESVLEHDLELYHHMKGAFGSASNPKQSA